MNPFLHTWSMFSVATWAPWPGQKSGASHSNPSCPMMHNYCHLLHVFTACQEINKRISWISICKLELYMHITCGSHTYCTIVSWYIWEFTVFVALVRMFNAKIFTPLTTFSVTTACSNGRPRPLKLEAPKVKTMWKPCPLFERCGLRWGKT